MERYEEIKRAVVYELIHIWHLEETDRGCIFHTAAFDGERCTRAEIAEKATEFLVRMDKEQPLNNLDHAAIDVLSQVNYFKE